MARNWELSGGLEWILEKKKRRCLGLPISSQRSPDGRKRDWPRKFRKIKEGRFAERGSGQMFVATTTIADCTQQQEGRELPCRHRWAMQCDAQHLIIAFSCSRRFRYSTAFLLGALHGASEAILQIHQWHWSLCSGAQLLSSPRAVG